MANQIANIEPIYNKVKESYLDGYKTYGTMLPILRELHKDEKIKKKLEIDFRNDNVRAKEITKLIVDLFDTKSNGKKTKASLG